MQAFIDGEPKKHFDDLCAYLKDQNIQYRINPHLVRGLDYYCLTVFEWVTTHLGAQGTVCAGGRYDGLVEQLGGKAMPAVGFALGLERTVLLLQEQETLSDAPDYYVISDANEKVLSLVEKLRHDSPHLKIEMNMDSASFGAQFKRADKSGAAFALIIGDNELVQNKVTVKNLKSGEQKMIGVEELHNV